MGGAPGKIDLYVGKEVVRRNIDNDKACDELIDLIKASSGWCEETGPTSQRVPVAAFIGPAVCHQLALRTGLLNPEPMPPAPRRAAAGARPLAGPS